MCTASPNGFWLRTHSKGTSSIWVYSVGPRFLVVMHSYGYGRHLACWIDGFCVDETALTDTDEIRGWVASNWEYHVKQLTYHEQMEYINFGLLQETD